MHKQNSPVSASRFLSPQLLCLHFLRLRWGCLLLSVEKMHAGCCGLCEAVITLHFKHLLVLPSFFLHAVPDSRLDRCEWAHLHCRETRWRAAETGGGNHPSLWEERVQTGGPQTCAGISAVCLLFSPETNFPKGFKNNCQRNKLLI